MAAAGQEDTVVLGPFSLDGRSRTLTRDGIAVALGGRALDVLVVLATAAGETVGKDMLLDRVWPGRIVEENNLQVQISALRKALGNGWIVTVPGRGYRLVVPSGAIDPPPLDGFAGKPSIAVLAFANLSGDQDQEYFSDGIAEDIITQLSHSDALFVIARNSSFIYKGRATDVKEIGRHLGVRYVLEGSVRRDGQRVPISALLVEAASGNHVWAERFDRAVTDIFVVQDQIADAVVQAIVPAISQKEQRRISRKPPESLGAWEAYQRGLWHEAKHTAADNAYARTFFLQAICLDSAFTPAYTELAHAYLRDGGVYGVRSLQEAVDLATKQATSALAIDPLDAEAHTVMSGARHLCGDRAVAAIHAEQALALDPNSVRARRAKAVWLLFGGHQAEARELFLEVLRLNSHDEEAARNRAQIAMSHYFEGDYPRATDAAKWTIAAHPGHPLAYRWLAASLGQIGRTDEARVALREAIQVSPQSFHRHVDERPPWMRPEDHTHMMDGLRKAGLAELI